MGLPLLIGDFPYERKDIMKYLIQAHSAINNRVWRSGDEGQSTAEYSLVILGAAAVALLLLSWAGSTGAIGNLFDSVISRVISKAP